MIIKREELKQKLNILSKSYSQKAPMPHFQFVKFDNDTLTMANQQTITTTKFTSNLQALIPFKQLSDICNKLTAEEIEIVIVENQAVIKCGKSKYSLNLGDFESYPNYNILNDIDGLIINCNEFKKCVSKINFATSKDEKRPILTGINFNNINAVSTDAYKLAKYDVSFGLNCTIASNDIINLISILNEENMIIRNNKNIASFEFGDTIYQTRLLDGNYPDTSRLIANQFEIECKINRINLIEAIDRANIFSNEDSNVIKLKIEENELIITSASNQVGNSFEVIDCESNKEIKLACNSNYLLETLNKFNNDEITLLINGELKPFVIKENELTTLILPVKAE